MFYVCFALSLFAFAVYCHVCVCKKRSKKQLHSKAFIIIAGILLGAYAFGSWVVTLLRVFDPLTVWGQPFIISSAFMYLLCIPVYLTFYVLTQLMSPSKKILLSIKRRETLDFEGIVAEVASEDFIGTRLNDLCVSGCVVLEKGRYTLSPSGRILAGTLGVMQFIFGRDTGG